VLRSLSQYPPWFVVACATVAAAALLWLIMKLVKVVLWILLIGVLVVGSATAVWMLLR